MVGKVVQNDPGWGERTKNGWGNFANRNPVGGKFRIWGGRVLWRDHPGWDWWEEWDG